MAYPNFYQPQPYYQPQPQQLQQARTGDFIPVPNEDVARNYPVAPGNSVNFKNENAPYIYTKTMGFSQFDQPIFKRYKLIEEEPTNLTVEQPKMDEGYKNIIEDLKLKIGALESEIDDIKKSLKDGV
jgi:hypothetical protein